MSYYCYMLRCADGTFYTGWTVDLGHRIEQHNSGRGARYTRSRRPVVLVYAEAQPDRTSAMKRELAIKALSHEEKARMAEKQ